MAVYYECSNCRKRHKAGELCPRPRINRLEEVAEALKRISDESSEYRIRRIANRALSGIGVI